MDFCVYCGAKLSEGAKFCTECGKKLPQAAPVTQPAPVCEAPAPVTQPETVYAAPVTQPEPDAYVPAVAAVQHTDVQKVGVKPPKPPKKGKSKVLYIILIAVVAVILAVVLFSCVGGKEDPNQGIYNGITYTYAGFEMDASDDWIELKPKGKLTMMLLGDEYYGKWELEGEALTVEQGGDTFYGTLSENVLILDLDGLIYTFEKETQSDASGENKEKETLPKEIAPENNGETNSKQYYVAISGITGGTEMNESTINQLGGVSLVLNGDGTGTFDMFGQSDEITYDDTAISRYNTPMIYAIDGDYLYLQVSDDIEFTMMRKMDAMNREATMDDLAYWEGDYYGWWVIDNVISGNSSAQGNWWDCCMTLDLDSDGSGTIIIWDEDYGKDDPIAEVEISASVYEGVTRFVSESGQFMGDEVGHADWLFYSDATDYPDTLGFSATYEDSDLKLECYFFLRQWGTIWDDVEEQDMPGYYESWYLPLINSGVENAPDTIG